MKFQVQLKEAKKKAQPYWETYDKHDVKTKAEAVAYGKWAVKYFNDTLRPGETAREYLDARIIGEGVGADHTWSKQNLMTLMGPHGAYDIVKCKACGVVARRYGIATFKRQKPFRSNKYRYCKGESSVS